jgi:sulfate/thiosulfate transport system ATP-binding protein
VSISIKNVSKSYGAFKALDNVSLDVPDGSLLALLGPSGSGKTTLLRIIAGLEVADSGQVLHAQEDITNHAARERKVGFVFQHYALFRHMTVAQNIGYGLKVRHTAQDQINARVTELLKLIRLEGLQSRYPSQLSGGQRQRVALARALAAQPRVLLLDEPFGALDAKVRQELRQWIRRLHDEIPVTSIFVTHDQEEAFSVADRIVLMNQGKIEQIGTAQEIYENPATAFAYDFFGLVNKFPGRIDGAVLRVGEDVVPVEKAGLATGQKAIGFARPHELRIAPPGSDKPGIAARIDRILPSGLTARIELSGPRALNGTGELPLFHVDVTRETLLELGLSPGQNVRLVTEGLKVFAYDKAD